MNKILKYTDKNRIVMSLCESILFAFMIAVFAPFEFFLSNKSSFLFGGEEMIGFTAACFCTVIVIAFAIFFVFTCLSDNLFKVCNAALFGLVIAFYIQGNLNTTDYGSLDGTIINWSSYKVEGIISLATFILIPAILAVLAYYINCEKYIKLINLLCTCMVLMLVVTLLILGITNGGMTRQGEYVATTTGEFEYSKNENIIILMLDSYDSVVFDNIIAEDSEYGDFFDGFTYMRNTSGMYIYTGLAVPHFLYGDKYYNDITYGEYLNQGYRESELFATLEDEGWTTGVYTPVSFPNDENITQIDNCKFIHRTVSSHRRLAEYMYKLVAFRYMPQQLKSYFWFYAEDELSSIEDNDEGFELYIDSNERFIEDLQCWGVNTENCIFKFIHLYGAHEPYRYNSDLVEMPEGTNIVENDKGILTMVNMYLDSLKAANVYDNSTIIICADHGTENRFAPLFIIKEKNQRGALRVSDTPFSYDYVQDLLVKVVQDDNISVEEMLNARLAEPRKVYEYEHVAFEMDGYSSSIEEYEVIGKANDSMSYVSTGEIYIH